MQLPFTYPNIPTGEQGIYQLPIPISLRGAIVSTNYLSQFPCGGQCIYYLPIPISLQGGGAMYLPFTYPNIPAGEQCIYYLPIPISLQGKNTSTIYLSHYPCVEQCIYHLPIPLFLLVPLLTNISLMVRNHFQLKEIICF